MATPEDLIPALSAELAVLGQRQAVRSDNRRARPPKARP
jgi:hypothetical protein